MHFAPYLDIKVDPELAATEPLGAVAVQADDVLPRHPGGEGELALAAVHLGQDDLVVRVPDLYVHPDLGAGGGEAVSARVVELDFVIAWTVNSQHRHQHTAIFSPVTIVSSGISSMKHFLSVSPMWK